MATYSKFDNMIIDAIYDLILRYFSNNVSFHYDTLHMYNKNWKYDDIGRVIYNTVEDIDNPKNEVEIQIGLSKNYDGYFIISDAKGGRNQEIKSKAYSLGSIVDNIDEDILNIENELDKGLIQGFLI